MAIEEVSGFSEWKGVGLCLTSEEDVVLALVVF